MSRPPNRGRRDKLRNGFRRLFSSTFATEPSASPRSQTPTRDSQDAVTLINTSLLHIPTSRPPIRKPSPTPQPREHRDISQTCATSSSLPADSAPLYIRTQSQPDAAHASAILADALEALEEQERETIRTLLAPNTIKTDDALHEAYNTAKELQPRSAMKKWSWTYRGRQVYIQDQADKLVRFMDRFKSVGDVIANIDPVHVGLPWAGFRCILDLALLDSGQRGAIAPGMEVTLFASHRLQMYLNMHFQHPPSPPPRIFAEFWSTYTQACSSSWPKL